MLRLLPLQHAERQEERVGSALLEIRLGLAVEFHETRIELLLIALGHQLVVLQRVLSKLPDVVFAAVLLEELQVAPALALLSRLHQGPRRDLLALGELAFPGGRRTEHTSELQSLMRISYAVFCLKKKTKKHNTSDTN